MTSDPENGPGSPESPSGPRTPEEIEADISHTRDDLARTVDQLSERVVSQTKQATSVAVKAAAAGAAVVLVYVVVRRVRARRS